VTATALLAAACLFALGCFGVLVRRQPAGVVMAAQLLWLAVVLVLVAVNQPAGQLNRGQGFALLRRRRVAAQDLTREKRNRVRAAIEGMQRGMPDPEAILRSLAEASSRKADAEARAQQAAHRGEGRTPA